MEAKKIIITGAATRIGAAIAKSLANFNIKILLHYNKSFVEAKKLKTSLEELGAEIFLIKADLNKSNETKKIIPYACKMMKGIDCLINNASILGKMSMLSEYDHETWSKVINVNLTASFLLSKSLIQALSGSAFPRIIFTSSGVANKGRAFWGAYAISKAATKSMAEIFKDELESTSSLKIFNFDPGATRTSMRAFAYPAEDPSLLKGPQELQKCYEWFFSKESEITNDHYFTFDSFKEL